jgi:hypothetical protein
MASAVVFSSTGPIGTRIDAVVVKVAGPTIACSRPLVVVVLIFSVATSPERLPDTSVTIAKPDWGAVSWAKAPRKCPEANKRKVRRRSKRTATSW